MQIAGLWLCRAFSFLNWFCSTGFYAVARVLEWFSVLMQGVNSLILKGVLVL